MNIAIPIWPVEAHCSPHNGIILNTLLNDILSVDTRNVISLLLWISSNSADLKKHGNDRRLFNVQIDPKAGVSRVARLIEIFKIDLLLVPSLTAELGEIDRPFILLAADKQSINSTHSSVSNISETMYADQLERAFLILTDSNQLKTNLIERYHLPSDKVMLSALNGEKNTLARRLLDKLENSGYAKLNPQLSPDPGPPYPRVSIVTPSFNQGQYIEATIQSVLSQDYPDIEYIVVDGGSTDNTLEVLKHYDSRMRWISEPDNGQTDAINKGMRLSTGEIVAYLNSDDYYFPGAVSRAVNFFRNNWNCGFIYGEGILADEAGNFIDRFNTVSFDMDTLASYCFILQPASFIKREAYIAVGGFDDRNNACMDYDMWFRLGQRYGAGYLNEYLAVWRVHDECKSRAQLDDIFKSSIATVYKYCHHVPVSWINGYSYYLAYGVHPMNSTYPRSKNPIRGLLRRVLKLYLWLKWNKLK